jgi:hypothetical protein
MTSAIVLVGAELVASKELAGADSINGASVFLGWDDPQAIKEIASHAMQTIWIIFFMIEISLDSRS